MAVVGLDRGRDGRLALRVAHVELIAACRMLLRGERSAATYHFRCAQVMLAGAEALLK